MPVTQSSTAQATTKEEILQHLLKQGDATAQDLAAATGVSPQAIRRHLKDLELDDRIVYQVVQAKLGRPQHRYQLSKKGRSHFPDSYDRFAVSLLDTLSEAVPPEQFREILKSQWGKKIEEYRDRIGNPISADPGSAHQTLRDRLGKLAELRRSEGFMSEVHPFSEGEGGEEGEGFVVTEYNCAIAHIAESFPTVCGHELELFMALFPDCLVKRTHWMIRGQNYCGYLIQQVNSAS